MNFHACLKRGIMTIADLYDAYNSGEFIFPGKRPNVSKVYPQVVEHAYEHKDEMLAYIMYGTEVDATNWYDGEFFRQFGCIESSEKYSLAEANGYYEVIIDYIEDKFEFEGKRFSELDNSTQSKYLNFEFDVKLYRKGEVIEVV